MLFILGLDLVVLIKLFISGSISTPMLLKYMRVHGGVVVKGEDNIPATKFVKLAHILLNEVLCGVASTAL